MFFAFFHVENHTLVADIINPKNSASGNFLTFSMAGGVPLFKAFDWLKWHPWGFLKLYQCN